MTSLNRDLIGIPGGRAQIETPALVIDCDTLERNIERMAAYARQRGVALRPHAKTHKCVEIAKRQIKAGALGICCAKLGEAEALGSIDRILITSPVVTDRGIIRLMALNARLGELIAVCDNQTVAAHLDEAARRAGKKLKLLIDIDPGMGRTGIAVADAVGLVSFVAQAEGLEYAGLQCYAGQVQHIESFNQRRDASLAALQDLAALRDRLAGEGLAPGIISGGGTGSYDIDPDAGVLTEIQAGSYIFMDRQYNDVWRKSGGTPPFETSLYVQTTVISANRAGLATTDAGYKAFATDAEPPLIAAGAPDGAAYFFFGDEQGGVLYSEENRKLVPGDVVTCVVPHCDPTVNLYDAFHLVSAETLVGIWPIDGRGRSQ